MWFVLFKEIIASAVLMGLAAIVIFVEVGHIPHNWFKLTTAIVALFPTSTLLQNALKKISSQLPGWILMGLSMLKMIMIPALIIILFDKEHEATPAVVIPTVIAYLFLMGLDTAWKIKWIFR